jgi:FKBP-type peptidyl-prolyl cis-trans isomerase
MERWYALVLVFLQNECWSPASDILSPCFVGVLKLHEGETAMIGIPPQQAYGPDGTPDGRIPGGSTLIFKIQLLEVMSAGIGGSPKIVGADGKQLKRTSASPGLLGADGRPL